MSVETVDYLRAVERLIRRAGVRVGDADEPELAQLVNLRETIDEAISAAVNGQRERTSWAGIGRALGITRQSAWERFNRQGVGRPSSENSTT